MNKNIKRFRNTAYVEEQQTTEAVSADSKQSTTATVLLQRGIRGIFSPVRFLLLAAAVTQL